MPKEIKKVEQVMLKARREGEATNKPYRAVYDGRMRLYHYGTLIFASESNKLTYVGGYSASDRDAIYTAFQVMGIPYNISNAQKKPSWARMEMNGWWLG